MKKITTVFFILSSYLSFGQNTAKFEGVVVNLENEPLAGATVFIRNTKDYFYTNSSGKFSATIPSNVVVQVVVSYLNKNTEENLPPQSSGSIIRRDYSLDYSFTLKEMVKTAEKQRPTISTIRIDPKKLERFPTAGGFEQNLKSIGLGISKAGGELSSAYSVRGGNFDENLTYINGIEVYRPFLVRSGQQEGLSIINPDMVESVDFSAGGFEAQFGDKLSSVLDIQYKKPKKFGATAHLSLLGAALHAEDKSKNGRFTYLVGARYRTNQYLLGSLDVQGDYKPRFLDFQSVLSYKLNADLTLNWLSTFAESRYLVIPQSQNTSFGNVNFAVNLNVGFGGQELMRYATVMNGLQLNYAPTSKLTLDFTGSAYNTNEKEYYTVEGAYNLSELDRDLGSDNFAQVKRSLGYGYFINNGRNQLSAEVYSANFKGKYIGSNGITLWGVGAQTEQINDKLNEWKYNDSSGYNINTIAVQKPTNSLELEYALKTKIQLSSYRLNGFVQQSYLLNEANSARIVAGVRSNFWSVNQENVISPRVQFSFEPNKRFNDTLRFTKSDTLLKKAKKDWLVKAAIGYYYQPPFYRELRNFEGQLNTNLRAQKSIHFITGGDLNFQAWGRPFKLVTEAYYKHLDRMVPYIIDNVRIRYLAENSAKGYAAGWDARINGEFVKGIESWLNVSIMSTQERIYYKNEKGQEVLSDWLRRPTDQRVNFSILFQDELPSNPSYKMNVNIVYGSRIPFFFDNNNRYNSKGSFTLAPYRRVDIGFSKVMVDENSINKPAWLKNVNSFWISLEVFNLLQVNNTISYTLLKDFENTVYGVPNYLTGRRLNLRFIAKI